MFWLGLLAGCTNGSDDGDPPEDEPTPNACITRTWDAQVPGSLEGTRAGRTEGIEVTIPTTGLWGFSTQGSNFDTVVALRRACDESAIARNDDWIDLESFVQADLEAGDVVIVEISPYSQGEARDYRLSIFEVEDEEETCDDELDNDADFLIDCQDDSCFGSEACTVECPDGTVMGELPVTVETVVPNRISGFESLCAGSFGAPERTFEFTAPEAGTYVFDTLGSSFDTVLAVFDGCDGAEIDCNDDTEGVLSEVQLDMDAEETVLLVIDGYGPGDFGAAVLTVSRDPLAP